jgi:hypothetical protein
MGPLFSALLAVILAVLYALAAYIVLRILRRRAVPFTSIAGVVVRGAVGAVLAILVLAPFFAGKTIQSTVVVVSYLSSIVGAAVAFSIVGLKFVERRKT